MITLLEPFVPLGSRPPPPLGSQPPLDDGDDAASDVANLGD